MVSEAGTKAVKVDGLFSWMAKLRCNHTVKHIITKEIVSRELMAVKYCTSSKRTQGSGQGTEHLALQIPNQAIKTKFCNIGSSFWAWVGKSNICKTSLWTPLFHQGFQCKEVVVQIPYSIRSSWAQLSGFAVPYHYTISLKWVWWRKSLALTKPKCCARLHFFNKWLFPLY